MPDTDPALSPDIRQVRSGRCLVFCGLRGAIRTAGRAIETRAQHLDSPLLDALEREIRRQDQIHPSGYPDTRDGIRLGIATAEDELEEARLAWRNEREGAPDMPRTREELLQVAALVMRTVRSVGRATRETTGTRLPN